MWMFFLRCTDDTQNVVRHPRTVGATLNCVTCSDWITASTKAWLRAVSGVSVGGATGSCACSAVDFGPVLEWDVGPPKNR